MGSRKVVFVMGNGHSGSTLLELILGSHARVFGLGEMNNLAKAVGRTRGELSGLCHVCEGRCEFWDGKVSHDVLRRHFSPRGVLAPVTRAASRLGVGEGLYAHLFAASGADILVDGSKSVSWIAQQLSPAWKWRDATPLLLHIVRDGRAVVNSRLRKYPERGIEQESRHWKRVAERTERYYRDFAPERRYRVVYEELATDPAAVIEPLCGFLGIDYDPAMLRYWEHDHHTTFGNTATRSLIARFRTQFAGQGEGGTVEVTRARHGEYYDQVGLAIRLDERWRRELSEEQLAVFETIGGETNRRLLAVASVC